MYRVRASAEDNTDNTGIVLRELVVRHNLAEGIKLANTAADELRCLRTEIKNYNLLLHYLIVLLLVVNYYLS